MTINADGTFDYVPDPDFFGTDSFTYQLEDPSGAVSAIATVTITVAPVNDAPIIGAGEDVALTFTENDTPLAIATGALVDDFGEGDIVSLTLTASGFGQTNPSDSLTIEGEPFLFGSSLSRSFTAASGVTVDVVYDGNETFTFTNQAGATIPADDIAAFVQGIRYINTSDSLADDTINFQFALEDSAGQSSTLATSAVSAVSYTHLTLPTKA